MLYLKGQIADWAAIAAVGACVAAGGAQAATITETAAVAGHEFIDPGQDVYVSEFNPALGTLTGASVSLTGQFTPGVIFGVNSPTFPPLPPVEFNPSINIDFSPGYNSGRLRQLLGSESVASMNGQAIGTPEIVDLTGPLSVTDLPLNPSFPGYLDFYILASSGTVLPPNTFFTDDLGDLTAQIAVTYTYTPGTAVPEPASFALLGAGVLGLCAVRSRARQALRS